MLIPLNLERRETLSPPIMKRETPQIGGSSAGFIALVVCLCMIIVITCTAIFFLLKHNDPTDAERAARRQRRYAHQSVPSSASYTYDPSSTPSKGWFSKVTDIFNNNEARGSSTQSKNRKNNKRGDGLKMKLGGSPTGWVQAGSGDEWDLGEEGDRGRIHTTDTATVGSSPLIPTPNPYSRGIDSPFSPPMARESVSSTYFDSHTVPGLSPIAGHRSDSPSSHPPALVTQSNPSSPVAIPPATGDSSSFPTNTISQQRSVSPEPMSAHPIENSNLHKKDASLNAIDTRKWSVQSGVSARTSGTGTKFIEEL
ncbi:hypothetical protein E1B28_011477 [Marasmius oreades]|uniref:Uncharacterized protein n=1 Tax=Marasmius oreades TaxID=181124 RepID=A0A9P7RUX6_9AGAR|nr:uncharacterized protein E1B28_011477 [Marasmius oreades]KAG7089830.1 hypothetical protein E1B28_011477 [Marasmius oreades]